jgi:hypothetical protein
MGWTHDGSSEGYRLAAPESVGSVDEPEQLGLVRKLGMPPQAIAGPAEE